MSVRCPHCGKDFDRGAPYESLFPEGHDSPPRIKCLICDQTFPVDPPSKPTADRTYRVAEGARIWHRGEWHRVTSVDGNTIGLTPEKDIISPPDRMAELREKYGPIMSEAMWKSHYLDAHKDINELLDEVEKLKTPTADEKLTAIWRVWNKWISGDGPIKTMKEVLDEIEKLKQRKETGHGKSEI